MRSKWTVSLMATLSLINVVSTGHVNYVSNLYCPEGYRNLRLNNTQLVNGDWAGAFEEQCQCKSGAQCRRDVRSNSYSCRLVFSYAGRFAFSMLTHPASSRTQEILHKFYRKAFEKLNFFGKNYLQKMCSLKREEKTGHKPD